MRCQARLGDGFEVRFTHWPSAGAAISCAGGKICTCQSRPRHGSRHADVTSVAPKRRSRRCVEKLRADSAIQNRERKKSPASRNSSIRRRRASPRRKGPNRAKSRLRTFPLLPDACRGQELHRLPVRDAAGAGHPPGTTVSLRRTVKVGRTGYRVTSWTTARLGWRKKW